MRIMTLSETAAAGGLTLEGLAMLRASTIAELGELLFPMMPSEVDWLIDQRNAIAEKYGDQKQTIARAAELIERQTRIPGGPDAGMHSGMGAKTVDAVLAILRGVE